MEWKSENELFNDINNNRVYIDLLQDKIEPNKCREYPTCCISNQQLLFLDNILLVYDLTIAPFVYCVNTIKRGDLRKETITGTHPFDFRNNIIYSNPRSMYRKAPLDLGYIAKFKTSFGNVILEFDNNYIGENSSPQSYVVNLYINGVRRRLIPIDMRSPASPLFQYME